MKKCRNGTVKIRKSVQTTFILIKDERQSQKEDKKTVSVLIKGYKLPLRCQECPFWKYEQPIWWRDEYIMWCSVTGEDLSKLDPMKRSDNCPMTEVKDGETND